MAAATMYVTAAGAGGTDGTDWANAMNLAAWSSDAISSAEAGDIYYVQGGQTYTLAANWIAANDGLVTSPITIIGVNSGTSAEPPTFSDWAIDDASRPIIAAGASDFIFDNYWKFKNLSVTTTDSNGFRGDVGPQFENCKSVLVEGVNKLRILYPEPSTN